MKSTKKTKKSKESGGHSGPARSARSQSPPPASRVVATLREAGRPLNFDELATRIGRDGKAAGNRLQAQLDELLQAGEIIRNRRDEYCLRERLPLVVGTVTGHRDGHGFVLPDDRSAPVFLAPRQMLETLHGDRVAVRISGQDNRGRPQGAIVEVLERNTREIVGRLYEESGISFVVPDNPRIGHRVFVPRGHLGGARAGQVVLVKLVEQPTRTAQALGHVTRLLGEHAAPGMETEIAIHSHSLPFEFPHEAVVEAEAFGRAVSAAAKRGREDLRELPLVTIDGEDARDFDDAVYCEEVRGGWQLIVAIADVASYVGPGLGARQGSAESRHVGLLSEPRPADVARGAVERAVLAEPEGRPPVHGVRDARQPAGQGHARAVLRGRDVLGRAADVHEGRCLPRQSDRRARAGSRRGRSAADGPARRFQSFAGRTQRSAVRWTSTRRS